MTTPSRAEPDARRSATALSTTGSATWLFERAALGALLCYPERIPAASSWLRAQDFADPAHRATFVTAVGLYSAGDLWARPPGADTSDFSRGVGSANLVTVREALEGQRFADRPLGSAHRLVEDLYLAGVDVSPAQMSTYGTKILEMSVRRQVEAWGVRIEQAATSEATEAGDVTVLSTTRSAMIEDLTDLANQVRRANGEGVLPRFDRNPVEAPEVVVPQAPQPGLVKRAELQVIHAVIADPNWRDSGLLERLSPEDFVQSPAHANTWRALQRLHRAGETIDPLMVIWECEFITDDPRRATGAAAEPVVLAAADLQAMTEPPEANIARAIDMVTRSSRAEHARLARDELQQLAADRGQKVTTVLDRAKTAGGSLVEHAQRLAGGRKPASSGIAAALEPAATPAPQQGPATRTR